jgi:hypothetical protein
MSDVVFDVVFGVVFACNLAARLTSTYGQLTPQTYDTSPGGFA